MLSLNCLLAIQLEDKCHNIGINLISRSKNILPNQRKNRYYHFQHKTVINFYLKEMFTNASRFLTCFLKQSHSMSKTRKLQKLSMQSSRYVQRVLNRRRVSMSWSVCSRVLQLRLWHEWCILLCLPTTQHPPFREMLNFSFLL